jgi:peptidoglycan/xylan/chitin deacetylase (PgdA/CDA1 family)
MTPGGRLWRVDAAAVAVAAAVVALFVMSMAVEQILPQISSSAGAGPTTPGRPVEPTCEQGTVALSFDGGPDPEVTGPLVDLLHQKRVTASFYVEVDRAVNEAALFRKAAQEGHQLGLYLPPGLTGAASHAVIDRARAHFALNGLRPLRLLRADHGHADEEVRLAVAEAGLVLVSETDRLDIGDRGLVAPATIEQRMLDGLHPGVTFVAHDVGMAGLNTLAALTSAIDEVHARGYCFGLPRDPATGRDLITVPARGDDS